ncbi:hypothetical protein VL10_20660 [Leclercia adecarboxylata]|nr:hypothetical protein VL10_20660 [Leclercia adecarboxylata]KMN64133.1 hypothetical protein VK95_16615 [Leclercia sp. LK8]
MFIFKPQILPCLANHSARGQTQKKTSPLCEIALSIAAEIKSKWRKEKPEQIKIERVDFSTKHYCYIYPDKKDNFFRNNKKNIITEKIKSPHYTMKSNGGIFTPPKDNPDLNTPLKPASLIIPKKYLANKHIQNIRTRRTALYIEHYKALKVHMAAVEKNHLILTQYDDNLRDANLTLGERQALYSEALNHTIRNEKNSFNMLYPSPSEDKSNF